MMTAILIATVLVVTLSLVAVGVVATVEMVADRLRKHFAVNGVYRDRYIMREYGVFAIFIDAIYPIVSVKEIVEEMDLEAQAKKADAFIASWESAQMGL